MQRLKWTQEDSVFLPEFDAEHRNLFHIAEEVQSAVDAQAEPSRIAEILRGLMAALEGHLTDEERRMRATRYPSYSWHKQQHDSVRRRVAQLASMVEAGDREAAILLLHYFTGWLHDHTSLTDRMLCAYLRNHERQAAAPVRSKAVTLAETHSLAAT